MLPRARYYDAEGNTVTKVNISTGETWTYTYDLNNRLVSAVDKQSNGTLIQQATYEYDALGDRIQESATAGGVTTTTNYAFNAAGNVWADLNGNSGNALATRRLFLEQTDEVFARIASGNAAWYPGRPRGVRLVDTGGTTPAQCWTTGHTTPSATSPAKRRRRRVTVTASRGRSGTA